MGKPKDACLLLELTKLAVDWEMLKKVVVNQIFGLHAKCDIVPSRPGRNPVLCVCGFGHDESPTPAVERAVVKAS